MLPELLIGVAKLLAYYLAMAITLFGLRKLTGLSGELYRKLFHITVAGSIFVLLHGFNDWRAAAVGVLLFGLAVYAVVRVAEYLPRVMRALRERKPGEIRSSLLLMFFTMAALIALGWGWLGADHKYMVAAPLMAWGFGDAAAALVGKRWGRRQLKHPWVDNAKTVEGTLAMLAFASAATFVTLLMYTGWPWHTSLLVALLVAPAAALTELVSRNGVDTVTVPLVTWVWLLILVKLLGFTGLL